MDGRRQPLRRAQLVRGLAAACHPAPTVAVTAVAVALAIGVGLSAARVVVVGAAVLTGQLSIGWSNDAIDAARDERTGRADKPVAAGRVPVGVVRRAAAAALVATIALSGLLGLAAGACALALVAAGWAYNLGLKSTVWSGAAYLVGFAALPAAPYLARPARAWPSWWVPAAGALLGLGAHFANVLPDLGDDAATGVRGLPHRLGRRGSVIALALSLAAASVVVGLGPSNASATFTAVACAVGIAGAAAVVIAAVLRPDSPAAFRVALVLAVADVALIVTVAL